MSMYVPAIVWILSAGLCFYIAKKRHIKLTAMRNVMIAFLGPVAIPIIFLSKVHA